MTKAYEPVPKTREERLLDLVQGLRVLADSLALLRDGKPHQILPIAGQLRALLSDKSTDPLLLSLAEELGEPLHVFVEGRAAEKRGPEQPESPLSMHIGGIRPTRHPFGKKDRRLTIAEYLDLPVVRFRSTAHSVRDIISLMANRAGGAHFAPDLPRNLGDLMQQLQLGSLPAPATIIAQLAEVTLDIGSDLLRRLGECEAHLLLWLNPLKQDRPHYVFDAQDPSGASRIFCFIDPMHRVHVSFRGISGTGQKLPTMQLINWDEPHHLSMSSRFTDNLETRLEILVDGEVSASHRVGRPIITYPNLKDHDVVFNGDPEDGASELEFGISRLSFVSPRRSIIERGRLYSEYADARASSNEEYLWFTPGVTGRKAAGETEPSGDFSRRTFQKEAGD